MKTIIIAGLIICWAFSSCCCFSETATIRKSVSVQLEQFPNSTLQDLYKNFFQDRFGPGHIISDTVSAGRYLRQELTTEEVSIGPEYTCTGYKSRFYRVNLSVIKDGRVSYRQYFDAFIRSVKQVASPEIEQWQSEWEKIDSVIKTMNLSLPNEDTDRETIDSMLRAGKYVIHHSDLYRNSYLPHYRLIEKSIFEQEILPLL